MATRNHITFELTTKILKGMRHLKANFKPPVLKKLKKKYKKDAQIIDFYKIYILKTILKSNYVKFLKLFF